MGQKVHPLAFRLDQGEEWKSRWYASSRRYSVNLLEDIKIRRFLTDKLKLAGLVGVEVERLTPKMKVIMKVTRPGMVIGRGGSGLEELKKSLFPIVTMSDPTKNLQIEVEQVKEPELSAFLVAGRVASEIERRLPHRRVAERAIERVLSAGAKGVKIVFAGRIRGAEIARRETFLRGKLPLSTIRANIDFASVPALTKLGYVGIKVWICRE